MWENPGSHDKHDSSHDGKAHSHKHGHSHHHKGHSYFLTPSLLLLLVQNESHGYELVEKLPEAGLLSSMPDPATVYRVLHKLEEDGAIESRWDTSGAGPARKVYSITPQGEDMLKAWGVTLKKKKQSIEKFLKVLGKKFGK